MTFRARNGSGHFTGDPNEPSAKEIALDLLRRQQLMDQALSLEKGPCFRSDAGVPFIPSVSPVAHLSYSKMMTPGLYGRELVKKHLRNHCLRLLDDRKDHPAELILVTAPSGFGKTQLVMSLQQDMFDRPVKLIRGKFQTRQVAPYTAYAEAMSELLHHMTECHHTTRRELTRQRIKDTLGDEGGLLWASIPALSTFLGDNQLEDQQNTTSRTAATLGPEALNHFRSIFCKLVASICSHTDPVILFLDDLQWAEKESLELLASLLIDDTIEGLVIVGAVRGDEMAIEDDLSGMLRDLEDNRGLCVNEIALSGLGEDDIVEMVSDLFSIPRSGCLNLGSYLYRYGNGQPLHTLQLLRALQLNGVITSSDCNLQFDEERAKKISRETGQDALQLVSDSIRRLPDELQRWLSIAAFLGAQIDEGSIRLAAERTCENCASGALQAGLITRTRGRDGTPCFRFVHDVVQQACYERIPREEREQMHFDIAMRIWKKTKESNSVNFHSITIANHLKYGIHMLKVDEQRVEAAELFSLASKQANLASAFQSACSFLRLARELLPLRTRWRDYYTISLEIFATSAETELVVGNFDECDQLCEHILKHGHCVVDMIPAYSTKMYSLGCRSRLQDAIDVGLKVMEDLGEIVPRNVGLPRLLLTLRKTENMLRNLSAGEILSLPRMRDPSKIAAMQILNVLFTYCYTQKPTLQVMVTAKMLEITLKDGLSACSAVGFAFHSVILCTLFERLSEAYRYAQISLDLLEAFGVNEYTARVYTYVYGCIMSAVRPVRECLVPLEHAHRCGIVTGDTEFSMFALHVYTANKFYQGTPVRLVFDEALEARQSMIQAGQESAALLQEAVVQALAGILDVSVSCAVFGGIAMTRQAMIGLARKEDNTTLEVVVYGNWAVELFWTGDYEKAAKYFRLARVIGLHNVTFHFRCCLVFLEGMANFILVCESPRRYASNWQRMRRGRRSWFFLEKHCKTSPANLLLQVQLLGALQAYIKGDWRLSMSKYLLAEERARETGMVSEEALTNELIGRALLRRNAASSRNVEGVNLLRRAKDFYAGWGAVHKVKTLETLLTREEEKASVPCS